MMADLAKIKRNVGKMATQGASEAEIDAYIASEGVTLKDVREYTPNQGVNEPVGVGEDVARSAAAGVRRGIEGIAGMGGDIRETAGAGAGWLFGEGARDFFTAQTPDELKVIPGLQDQLPTTADVRKVTNAAVGTAYQPQTTAGEYARTVGEFAPAAVFGPGGLARRAATQAVAPAVVSEAAGQATEGTAAEPWARLGGALAGNVGAAAGLSAGRKAITPHPVTDPARIDRIKTLQREGVESLTAGQKTGSKTLKAREAVYLDDPLTQQSEEFTQAVLRRIGVDSRRATPEVMENAAKTIGRKFDDLAARNQIVADRPLVEQLQNMWMTFRDSAAKTAAPGVRNITKELVDRFNQGQPLSGADYSKLNTRLNKLIRTAQPAEREAFVSIKRSLDDAMERQLALKGSPDLGAWREARNEYRNLLSIEEAVARAGSEMDLISPQALRSVVKAKEGARRYTQRQGDLAELADAGKSILKPYPDSGTPGRLAAMVENMPAALGGLGGYAASGDPATALLAGAAGAMARPVAEQARRSVIGSRPYQAYIGNQVLAAGGGNPVLPGLLATGVVARPQGPR